MIMQNLCVRCEKYCRLTVPSPMPDCSEVLHATSSQIVVNWDDVSASGAQALLSRKNRACTTMLERQGSTI